MHSKFEPLYLFPSNTRQTFLDTESQLDTQLINPDDPLLPSDVRHLMNKVSVLRSTNPGLQNDLLQKINRGAEGYKTINYDDQGFLSIAFGLYLDRKISRFQFETLIDLFHFYHQASSFMGHGEECFYETSLQMPFFYSCYNSNGEISRDCSQILIDQLKSGFFLVTRASDVEIEAILNEIRELPVADQFFYQVIIPESSHSYKMIEEIFRILGSFPYQIIDKNVKLTVVSTSIMHIIGNVLFPKDYVPNSTILGLINPQQIMKALDVGVRLKTSYIPWSNAKRPEPVHGYITNSISGLGLHDLYHSWQATVITHSITDCTQALIKLIRDKILIRADWSGHQFHGRAINVDSCKPIWVLYESEFYSLLKFAFPEIDLRDKSSYCLSKVLYEIFYTKAAAFKPKSDPHMDLFFHPELEYIRHFSALGLTIVIDFLINQKNWEGLGFYFKDFKACSEKEALDSRCQFLISRKCYDIFGVYEKTIEPYRRFFTGNPIKDYLKYCIFNNPDVNQTPKAIHRTIEGLDQSILKQFRFRRNNFTGSLHVYSDSYSYSSMPITPETPLIMLMNNPDYPPAKRQNVSRI